MDSRSEQHKAAASALAGWSTTENPVQEASDRFTVRVGLQVVHAAEGLGNPGSDMHRAAAVQTAFGISLRYATVASVLGETEEKAQRQHRTSFWLEVQAFLAHHEN